MKIPEELKNIDAWTNTVAENVKVPVWAKKDWQPSSFSDVFERIKGNGKLPGLVFGYIDHPYIIIDIDVKTDNQHTGYTDEIDGTLLIFLNALKELTYVEHSMSGKGYHAILKITDSKDGIEHNRYLPDIADMKTGSVYTDTGFCIVTGRPVENSQTSIHAFTANEYNQFVDKFFSVKKKENLDKIDEFKAYCDTKNQPKEHGSLQQLENYLRKLKDWPTVKIKEEYQRFERQAYEHYDFWLKIICSAKDYAHTFNLSDVDTLQLLNTWSMSDITGSYDQIDSAGLSGYACLNTKYKSFKVGIDNRITYNTLIAYGKAAAALTPHDILTNMNKYHFLVTVGNRSRYGYEMDENIEFLQINDIREIYINKVFKMGKAQKEITYFDFWRRHSEKRKYRHVVFNPKQINVLPDYNLWKGFSVNTEKVKIAKIADAQPVLSFIQDIICSDNEALTCYVLDWIADIIQQPSVKKGVALVLSSDIQGTGKTFFCEMIGSMMKKNFMLVDSTEQILGRFNGHLADKLLVGVEEAIYAGSAKDQSALKSLITIKNKAIERKGLGIEDFPNYTRYIFTSNLTFNTFIELSDRRYQIIGISDKRAKDVVYFGNLYRAWKKGMKEAFFKFLQERNITSSKLINDRIVTKQSLEQKRMSLSHTALWLKEFLVQGVANDGDWDQFLYANSSSSEMYFRVSVDSVYEHYLRFVRQLNVKYPQTKNRLTKLFRTIFKNSFSRQKTMTKNRKTCYYWLFPVNAEEQFEKYYGFSIYDEGENFIDENI